jgi:hypothetical protein
MSQTDDALFQTEARAWGLPWLGIVRLRVWTSETQCRTFWNLAIWQCFIGIALPGRLVNRFFPPPERLKFKQTRRVALTGEDRRYAVFEPGPVRCTINGNVVDDATFVEIRRLHDRLQQIDRSKMGSIREEVESDGWSKRLSCILHTVRRFSGQPMPITKLPNSSPAIE